MADAFPVVIAQRSEYCQLKRGMVSPIFLFSFCTVKCAIVLNGAWPLVAEIK